MYICRKGYNIYKSIPYTVYYTILIYTIQCYHIICCFVHRARQSYKLRCFALFDNAINIRVNQTGNHFNLIPTLYAVIASCRYVDT